MRGGGGAWVVGVLAWHAGGPAMDPGGRVQHGGGPAAGVPDRSNCP